MAHYVWGTKLIEMFIEIGVLQKKTKWGSGKGIKRIPGSMLQLLFTIKDFALKVFKGWLFNQKLREKNGNAQF